MKDSITSSPEDLARDLLDWYDRQARDLPWRIGPAARRAGVRPDPYHVWLSEVMLQQTTVAAVKGYFETFTTRWPTVRRLAAAPADDLLAAWAGLGYYARARNLHRCARVVADDLGERFPETEEGLRALPGIGAYTAAAIAAIAFDRPSAVLDGNVERVLARMFAVTEPLPGAKGQLRLLARRLTPEDRPGCYAQAVMDLGATVCTPRRPACGVCPWMGACLGRRAGIAEALPQKAEKTAKPTRFGTAWAAFTPTGDVVCVRRPAKGLLGGMLALPTSDWAEGSASADPPFVAAWRDAGEVRHTFTHFHLRLRVLWATRTAAEAAGAWPAEDAAAAMPTVFAKALRLARAASEG